MDECAKARFIRIQTWRIWFADFAAAEFIQNDPQVKLMKQERVDWQEWERAINDEYFHRC